MTNLIIIVIIIVIVKLKLTVLWMVCVIWKTVYQAIIFLKENVKDKKKLILEVEKYGFMGLTPEIQWRILKRCTTPSCFDGRCNLYLKEKIQIMLYFDPGNPLNQRCDLIARCRHKSKFRLFSKISEYINKQKMNKYD